MIKIGEIKRIEIIDLNHLGQGVGKLDDFVYFVDGGIIGDVLDVKIKEVKKSYAICEIIKIINKSPLRVESKCEHYPMCGGCQILDLSYDEQLKYKKSRVYNELKKASINLDTAEIFDTIGMENPYRYRNKTALSVGKINGKIAIGTYEQKSHQVVQIDKCLLQDELADKTVKIAKEIFEKYNVEPYNEITKKGCIRHIVMRISRDKEIMLIIVTNMEELPNAKKIVEEFTSKLPQIKTIVQNINNKSGSLILGYKNKTLFGDGTIIDYIEDFKFVISPHTFFQVNSEQTLKLYEKAIEYAELDKNDICFDLYCGIGTISLMAAQKSKKVYGVEIVEQSIKDAIQNSKVNRIYNTEFVTGKVENILPKMYKKGIQVDVIIVDPPRKGCEKEVIEAIANIHPKRVVYVSCNPSTLARDLKLLQDKNFLIKKVQPVDMFSHSTHVETVVKLTLNINI